MIKIEYKDKQVFHSCNAVVWHPILIDVVIWIVELYNDYEKPFVITEGSRKPLHPNDLHGVIKLRAIDARSWVIRTPDIIAADINRNWIYDPKRPSKTVCVYHDTGSGDHFHIQVHPNTYLII